ncbi:MAG: divalent-cation tolerance protein CutA [Friedmanniella sp.]
MPIDDLCEVVITASDEQWLVDFTRQLVTDRLAACGHHSQIRSVYTWEGSVQDDPETRVALHTRASLVESILARTLAVHPYAVPCVVALPIRAANPAYADWVREVTRSPGD